MIVVAGPRIDPDALPRHEGLEVRAYVHNLYRHLADRLEANPALRAASLVVRFEDLCRSPHDTIRQILAHCRLDAEEAWVAERAAAIRFPSYYQPRFAQDELETIARHTADTAARFGYPSGDAANATPVSP